MNIYRTKAELQAFVKQARQSGDSIGFVPTMGFLHEGHASLLRQARLDNDKTVLSIFVNPLQFGPNEDLDRYPRDEQRDLALARECGVDAVFMPDVKEMYPNKPLTSVIVNQITERLCAASRPGHFDGVGTVVSKLFHLVMPDRAYFGMKDAQQLAVIEQMVQDLDFPVAIIPCPIVREPDGLALSSRNVYLSALHRQQAVVLSQTLELASAWLKQPSLSVAQFTQLVIDHIGTAEDAVVDYAELLSYPSFGPLDDQLQVNLLNEKVILALAVKFGSTRLIDNRLFDTTEG